MSDESKVMHTPGPWKVLPPRRAGGALGHSRDCGIVADNNGRPVVIGEVWLHGPDGFDGSRIELEPEANARLMAAAPDLLAALEAYVAGDYLAQGSTASAQRHNARRDAARAAIRAARGEG